jgi:hypothetical protein
VSINCESCTLQNCKQQRFLPKELEKITESICSRAISLPPRPAEQSGAEQSAAAAAARSPQHRQTAPPATSALPSLSRSVPPTPAARPQFLLFRPSAAGAEAFGAAAASAGLKGRYVFATVGERADADLGEFLGVDPAAADQLVLFDVPAGRKYRPPAGGGAVGGGVGEAARGMAAGYEAGTLEAYRKTQAVAEGWDEGVVKAVVGSQFDAFVRQASRLAAPPPQSPAPPPPPAPCARTPSCQGPTPSPRPCRRRRRALRAGARGVSHAVADLGAA